MFVGVALHITDAAAVRSFPFTVQLLLTVRQLYPREFRLLDPPYEYETIRRPIDILYGSSRLREALCEEPVTEPCLLAHQLCGLDRGAWWARTARCL